MPACIARFHDNFIYRLVDTNKEKIIRKYRVALAKDK